MKKILGYLFLFVSSAAFSQNAKFNGNIVFFDDGLPTPGLSLKLVREDQIIKVNYTDIDGNYEFKDIPFGHYQLEMTMIGFRSKVENIAITASEQTQNFSYPDPCPIAVKWCPKGHDDQVIPIVYGFPNRKLIKKSARGTVKLGGCNPSLCEEWHCKIHNLDF
jgi:hypothetical protein